MSREGFIGGSDIAAIFGISKFKTPYSLYLEKIGKGVPLSREQEIFFQSRKLTEPYILSVLKLRKNIDPVYVNRRFVDEEYDFMSAEIDCEFLDQDTQKIQNGELKSIGVHCDESEWGDEGTCDVPHDYLLQSMYGLSITKRDLCNYYVMKGFDDFREYTVFRDDELIEMIRERACEFWQRIVDRNPPPPQSVSDFKIRKPNGLGIAGNEEIYAKLAEIKRLKKEAKNLESLEDDVRMFIGDNDYIVSDSKVQATWNVQQSERIDESALKTNFPDIYKQCLKVHEFRVLRIK